MIDKEDLLKQDRQTYEEIFRDNSYAIDDSDINAKNVLDIGANIGLFASYCFDKGAKKVVSVEAHPAIFGELLHNVTKLDTVYPLNFAVMDRDNDTVKIENKSVASTVGNVGEDISTITVKTLLNNFEPDDNDITLKIDIEGSEYDVILNMEQEVASRFSTLFIEIHAEVHNKYKGFGIIKDKLKGLGFTEVNNCPMVLFDDWDANGNRINERPLNVEVLKYKRSDLVNTVVEPKAIVECTGKPTVLCSISTKDRYYSTLPLVIQAIITQTHKPDKLNIYDDGEHKDLRTIPTYNYLFNALEENGIAWEVIFGNKQGQHYNHQHANSQDFTYIWRCDDDTIPNPDVLERLLTHMTPEVGAVAGAVLMPNDKNVISDYAIKLEDVFDKPNAQWTKGNGIIEVEHLYSSFLYRPKIVNYELSLSSVAHREETIFSHRMFKKGYKLLVDQSIVTYHYRNPEGGIRTASEELFKHDDNLFRGILKGEFGYYVIALDCGLGDHYAFKNILSELKAKYKKLIIACCYPEAFHDEPAIKLLPLSAVKDFDTENVYKWMITTNWGGQLVDAFRKVYL